MASTPIDLTHSPRLLSRFANAGIQHRVLGVGFGLLALAITLVALELGVGAVAAQPMGIVDGRALLVDALRLVAFGLGLGAPAALVVALGLDVRRSRLQTTGAPAASALAILAAPPSMLALTLLAMGVGTPAQGGMALALILGFGLVLRTADSAFASVTRPARRTALALGLSPERVTLRMVAPACTGELLRGLADTGIAILAAGSFYVLAWGRLALGLDEALVLVGMVLVAATLRWRRRLGFEARSAPLR